MNKLFDEMEVWSIPEQIGEQIKKKIINRELRPGDKLPSLEELAENLNVSKPTVRSALQTLYETGLVSILKGRNGGYFVTEFYPDNLMKSMSEMITFSLTFNKIEREHLLEVRKMIEIPCVDLAARNRTNEDIKELEKINKIINQEKYCDTRELLELDLKLHLAIARSTQNPLATTIINAITKSFLESNINWNNKMITANTDSIVQAILRKDPDAARREMEIHMDYFLLFQSKK